MRPRVGEWRIFGVAMALAVAAFLVMATGCASSRMAGYDIPPVSGDSAKFVPVHIENHRTQDLTSPHFYLLGSGRHSLGVVEGLGGKLNRLIDTRWLDADGCFVIIAHYVGQGELVFAKACWHSGESVYVALDNIFVPSAAWSHR